MFETYDKPEPPNEGALKIYLEPELPNEGGCTLDLELESPNEGACLRYISNRHRQMRGVFKSGDEVAWPNDGACLYRQTKGHC